MKTNLYFKILIAVSLAFAAISAHAATAAYYIYDEDGHVIGEYNTDGTPVQEHVYLDNRPVAVVQNSNADYVSTDQLDTPRIITDSNKNVVWQWNSDPYGNGQPAGSLTYNLRFPGQYFDAETGHNYNYHRDYDPTTGRYTESDPIGLRGGINTYAYVGGNPLSHIDPRGLESPSAACGGARPGTAEYATCGDLGPVSSSSCKANDDVGVSPWTLLGMLGTIIAGGGPEDPAGDLAALEEYEAAEGAASAYENTTAAGASVTNITTDVSAEEAGATLESNGYLPSPSADGQSTIYTNSQGDTYIIRPSSSAPGGSAIDHVPSNGSPPVKVNLGGGGP